MPEFDVLVTNPPFSRFVPRPPLPLLLLLPLPPPLPSSLPATTCSAPCSSPSAAAAPGCSCCLISCLENRTTNSCSTARPRAPVHGSLVRGLTCMCCKLALLSLPSSVLGLHLSVKVYIRRSKDGLHWQQTCRRQHPSRVISGCQCVRCAFPVCLVLAARRRWL